MAPPNPKTKTPTPAQVEADEPAKSEGPELPIVHTLGLTKVSAGWVVVELFTQGKSIIESNILHGPDLKAICMRRVQLEMFSRFGDGMAVKGKGPAN